MRFLGWKMKISKVLYTILHNADLVVEYSLSFLKVGLTEYTYFERKRINFVLGIYFIWIDFFFELVLELFLGVEEASKILSLACQLCHCSSVSQAIKNIINSKSTLPIHNIVLSLPYLRPNINFAKKINTIAYKPNFSSYTTAYLKLYAKFVIKFTVFQNLHVTLEMYMYKQLHRQLHRHKQCSYCSIFKEIKNRLSFFILMHLRLVNGIFRFDVIC